MSHKLTVSLALLCLGLAVSSPHLWGAGGASPQAASQKPVLTTLHRFANDRYGGLPNNPLTLGTDGNFYGVTGYGGVQGAGTVFRMTPQGQFTTLFAFNRRNGHLPLGQLVEGKDGNFYGVTSEGFNTNYAGTVFRITPQGVLKTLHIFPPLDNNHKNTDGAGPQGGLVLASDGNFYGTTYLGGLGKGVAFRITPQGKYTVLHNFRGLDGVSPHAPLVQASDGNFYGTTVNGGADYPHYFGSGTIFRMTPQGSVTLLHTFDYAHGAYPTTGLTIGADGAFYGTTAQGGLIAGSFPFQQGYGTLFRITKTGVFTTLHRFSEDGHGIVPYASLTLGSDGNLYGTAAYNLYNKQSYQFTGSGSIFRLAPTGQVTTLYKFHTDFDGAIPYGGVVFGSDGALYGTTLSGGSKHNGTIYKLTLPQ